MVTPQDGNDDDNDSATDDAPDENDIDPDTPRSGSCGASLNWAYNSGVLTIQGSGAMNSFQDDGSDCPWEPFKRIITRVMVNGATSIGDYAFSDLAELSSVQMASSVRSIGAYAFAFDDALSSVTLPGVTSIGESAFAQCTNLSSASLPSSLTVLSDYAFSETAITRVTISGSVKTISEGAFSDCERLSSVTIENGVQTIGAVAFENCTSLKAIEIPSSVTSIASDAFSIPNEDDDSFDMLKITIRGAKGSAAETFAKSAGLKFEKKDTEIKAEAGKLEVNAKITNGNAVLDNISQNDIEKAAKDSTNGEIVLDVSDTKQEVHSVALSGSSLKNLADAVQKNDNVESVTVNMGSASIKFDTKALASVSNQASNAGGANENVEIQVKEREISTLNEQQQNALAEFESKSESKSVLKVFDFSILSGNQTISDFEGGTATVSLDIELEAGQDPQHFHIYYVNAAGELEPLQTEYKDGKLVATLSHFSEYAVVYDETKANDTAADPEPEKQANSITAKNVTKTWSAKAQSFNLGAKANGGASLSYKSDNKSVTVNKSGKVTVKAKFVGKATITITSAENDTYKKTTKKVTVTVKPTKTALSKVKAGKAQMTVQWKKNTSGKGYEIQYATDKAFKKEAKTVKIGKNATVKTTIKKLKKGTYYVRIRTVSGKISSDWSGAKTVKI